MTLFYVFSISRHLQSPLHISSLCANNTIAIIAKTALEDISMKATGIVRRIDELGRIVIPKEIRRTMRIRNGDPLQTALTQWEAFCFAMDDLAKRNGWK